MRGRAGLLCGAAVIAALLAGCGTDSQTTAAASSIARGTLIYDPPPRVASLDAATLEGELSASASGQQLMALAGAPVCGVDVYYISYWTVDAVGEATNATGALMVPTGGGTQCSGPRPIVLYAHGTTPDKTYNIADIGNPADTEGVLVAAMFAAQGYIVVAPNYAGYDASSLTYHPFLNAQQQSEDMTDALAAARKALPDTASAATSDNGQLFITGDSEGGYVAMATERAMETSGVTVTATAPISGPYALEAFGDAIFFGEVNIGSTVFGPLLVRSYQFAYANLYSSPTDIFEPNYATNAVSLLPSTTPIATIFANGELPETAFFSNTPPVTGTSLDALLAVPSNAVFASGFGASNLVTNDYRLSYVEDAVQHPDGAVPATPGALPAVGVPLAADPQNTLRQDLQKNDMRAGGWVPHAPMLMCGGDGDPTVFFGINTGTMAAYWSHLQLPSGLITVLDVAESPGQDDPFAALQTAFQQTETAAMQQDPQAAAANYEETVAPFCTAAARAFFSQF